MFVGEGVAHRGGGQDRETEELCTESWPVAAQHGVCGEDLEADGQELVGPGGLLGEVVRVGGEIEA